MTTPDELKKLTVSELKERCLDTSGCKNKQDYINRILEEEEAANLDGADADFEGDYGGEGQYDDQAGIDEGAAEEAEGEEDYAEAEEEPAAAAAAPSNGASRKHKPIMFPAGAEAGKPAAAAVPLEAVKGDLTAVSGLSSKDREALRAARFKAAAGAAPSIKNPIPGPSAKSAAAAVTGPAPESIKMPDLVAGVDDGLAARIKELNRKRKCGALGPKEATKMVELCAQFEKKAEAAREEAANGPKGPTEVNRSAEALAARAAKFAAPGTKHAPVVAPVGTSGSSRPSVAPKGPAPTTAATAAVNAAEEALRKRKERFAGAKPDGPVKAPLSPEELQARIEAQKAAKRAKA